MTSWRKGSRDHEVGHSVGTASKLCCRPARATNRMAFTSAEWCQRLQLDLRDHLKSRSCRARSLAALHSTPAVRHGRLIEGVVLNPNTLQYRNRVEGAYPAHSTPRSGVFRTIDSNAEFFLRRTAPAGPVYLIRLHTKVTTAVSQRSLVALRRRIAGELVGQDFGPQATSDGTMTRYLP